MKNRISSLIRYKGQDPISWFQTFQPLVNKYKKAIGLCNPLNDDELKTLWKEHFARQITVNELKTLWKEYFRASDNRQRANRNEDIPRVRLTLTL